MLGSSHAASGLLVGTALAAAVGSHPSDLIVCAAVGAGAALLPDLDEPGSTVGRSLGKVSRGLSRRTRQVSSWAFQATATQWDTGQLRRDEQGVPGGHRHLTHTLPAVVAYGLLGWGLAALGPLGVGVVVFAMAALGGGLVLRSVRAYPKPQRRKGEWKWVWKLRVWLARAQAVAGTVLLGAVVAAAAVVFGAAPWLVGLTVAVGALVHVLGDWLTRAGVPLAWPLRHRGKRWWMFRSPVAFVTGKSRVEDGIRWVCLAGAPAVAVLAVV